MILIGTGKGYVSKMQVTKEREREHDYIRVTAMLFVIAVHIQRDELGNNLLFNEIIQAVFFTCNGIFYMLSGRFNLRLVFEKKEDYIRYYKKKFSSVFLPFILLSFVLYLYNCRFELGSATVCSIMKSFYKSFFDSNAQTHLWFMYPLIGMLFSVPFLSKMVHAMTEFELRLCLIIGMLWNFVMVYLTADWNIDCRFDHWILASWTLYFLLGYYCSIIDLEKHTRLLYILGIAGGVLTVLQNHFLPDHSKYINDLAPLYVLFTVSMYVFLLQKFRAKGKGRWITRIAGHSFTVYILHWEVKNITAGMFINISSPVIRFLLRIAACTLISLALAIMVDEFILNPIKKLCRRLIRE